MSRFYRLLAPLRPAWALALLLACPLLGHAQAVSLTTLGTAYTQDFNTLASTGSTNPKSTLPNGWDFVESGTGADATYATTLNSTGNTYSLGIAGTNVLTERAFGTLNGLSAAASSTIGVKFTNNTGSTITGLTITYAGEQWREGNTTRTQVDRLDFQYSLTATDIVTGTFTDYDPLDLISVHTNDGTTAGNLDGNAAANRRPAISSTLAVTIPNGSSIILRWFDLDVTGGADDALGVDDFSLTPTGGTPPTVTTTAPTYSGGTTATVGGNVTAAGSTTVTDRGVVYSTTNATPTVGGGANGTQLAIGSGTGTFSSTLLGLSLGYTTYYVVAYATNSAGTAYGTVSSFTTGPTSISLTAIGTAYTQNFNTLPVASSVSTTFTKSTLPAGWDFAETLANANELYASQAGSTGSGDTYSLGSTGTVPGVNPSTDRALGSVNSTGGTPAVASVFGAAFVNNTGSTIQGLNISFTGEQWRLGSNTRVNIDRLDFQYSTTATSLGATTGFVDYDPLDFASPYLIGTTGTSTPVPLDGNLAANRTAVSATLGGLSIAPGATFYIRWNDFDVQGGGDDASGVDDFSITPVTPPTVTTATPSGVTGSAATVGGTVTSAGTGGGTPSYGVVYSSSTATPSVGGTGVTTVPVGTGLSTFSTSISGLAPNTLYYVAAYATTATAGTGYGAVQSFMTGASVIPITAFNTAYTEDFNSLLATTTIITGTTTNGTKATLPVGWDFVETDLVVGGGSDNTYSAATPSTGNTYSLGGNATNPSVNPNSDRAFGGVQNGNVLPTIGAVYVNNTGSPINGITISYTGEQWRVNNGQRTATDYLNFEYSTNATSLTSGTYQPVSALDFAGPNVGSAANATTAALVFDGNLPANRTALTATFPVSIAPGATFYIRWSDFNAPGGADDALGVDDFSLTALTTAPPVTDLVVRTTGRNVSGTYNNVTVLSGGEAVLNGGLTVNGALQVQAGGALTSSCQVVSGLGSFTLQAQSTLRICDAVGISTTGASGPVQVSGTRSFSTDANYDYNGTVAQATGSGLPGTVRSLAVNTTGGLTLSQPVSVAQFVRLTAGNLTTNGQMLTLLSVIGQGTALIDNTGGTVVGTGTMQRAVDITTNDNIGYHHYSSPVVTTPINDLQTPGFDFVLNPAFNTATLSGQTRPYPTVFGYDEARLATSPATDLNAFDKGFFSPTSGDAMAVGHGYTASVPNALTVDFVGTFNNGNVNITGLTRGASTDAGWQLLGNPYPSAIDWSTVGAGQRTNLDASAYVYHATSRYSGFYTTYLGSLVTNGINGQTLPIIDAGAGFFTRVSAGQTSGALALTNTNRLTSFANQPSFGRQAGVRAQLQLQVRGAGSTDALTLYTDAAATAGLDAEYDATKLTNPNGLNWPRWPAAPSWPLTAGPCPRPPPWCR